jgi:hypothetical protein
MTRLARATAGAALLLFACNTERTLYQMGFDTELVVTRALPRGGYLDATLRGEAGTVRLFTPPTEACRRVLAPEATVEFESVGAGRVSRDGAECDAAGFGPVEELSRRRPDPTDLGSTAIPREQADWRIVHQDAEVSFLRGRFPLSGLVGWAGGDDTIAVVSSAPQCREIAARGVGSLEYRPRGDDTLALVGSQGLCRVEALIRPMPR